MVADKIDMSLDDIISSTKRGRGGRGRGAGGRGRGGGRGFSNTRGGRGGGAMRRGGRGGSGGSRFTPYSRPRNDPDKWEHDMYDGAGGRANSGNRAGVTRRSEGLSTGSHLQISNLDFGVTESDIKELFSEFGKLKKAMINYDASGRSHGTADVVFERKADALKAFNTYNGVPLDGRPMKIEIVTATVAPTSFQGSGRSDTRSFRGNNQGDRSNNNFRNSSRSRGGRGFGRGRARGRGGRGRRETVSKDDLDKELDSYKEIADS